MRVLNILQYYLLIFLFLIGDLETCEGQEYPFANRLKFLEINMKLISADHVNHLLHFLCSMLFLDAIQKETNIFEGETTILVDVDNMKSSFNFVFAEHFLLSEACNFLSGCENLPSQDMIM